MHRRLSQTRYGNAVGLFHVKKPIEELEERAALTAKRNGVGISQWHLGHCVARARRVTHLQAGMIDVAGVHLKVTDVVPVTTTCVLVSVLVTGYG